MPNSMLPDLEEFEVEIDGQPIKWVLADDMHAALERSKKIVAELKWEKTIHFVHVEVRNKHSKTMITVPVNI